MNTVSTLYHHIREHYPVISASADRIYAERWEDFLDDAAEHAWFEALADALNEDVGRDVSHSVHQPLFEAMAGAFNVGSAPVRQCIDVLFVENLFWSVPSEKCAPYWKALPPPLKQLYLRFHGREP